MSESKKSGEFILKNLQIYTEAFCFFENSVNPKIESGIDNCIEEFSKKNNWNGKFQIIENDNWLHPPHWANEDGLAAKFEVSCTQTDDDDDNPWVSLFCKKSSNNCEAGFFFSVETRQFGGKRAWDSHFRNIPEDQKNILKEIGFKEFNGRFFLPITLSSEELAKSWMAADPFTPDDECFEPLRQTLEKLKQSIPIFEAIMQSALASKI